MQSKNYVYVNCGFVPPAEATVSVFDSGFLYGDGVFETMRVYGGKIFKFDQHMRRLFEGLQHLRIEPPFSAADVHGIFQTLCEKEINHGVARIHVTRGTCALANSGRTIDEPTVIAWAWPRALDPSPTGLRVMISSIRVDSQSLVARVKSANRLPFVMARQEAERSGADEAVLLNERGHVTEFTTANLFAVIGGRVLTPPVADGALPGITRAVVLQLAEKLELAVKEMELKPSSLAEAGEIFATNSVREIVPVLESNGRKLPSQAVTTRLQEAYRKLVYEELAL
jgi:branched-chain amino acid aminotransferase